jgi:hypothetical protein
MKIISTTICIIFYLHTQMRWYAICFYALFLHQNQWYRCSKEVEGTTVILLMRIKR